MTNIITLGSDNKPVTWNIDLGKDSSLSFEFFEVDGVTPLDLSSWELRSVIYNHDDHMLFDLDFVVENNLVTLYASDKDTAIMNRPKLEKVKTLRFEFQGISPNYDFENTNEPSEFFDFDGTVVVTDQNQ